MTTGSPAKQRGHRARQRMAPGDNGAASWERHYAHTLLLVDTTLVIVSVFSAQALRYGFGFVESEVAVPITSQFTLGVLYSVVSLVLGIAWLCALGIADTRDPSVFGVGPLEYRRVVHATVMVFGIFAIVAFCIGAQIGRSYLLIAFPIGLILLLSARYLTRKALHARRRHGRSGYRTLLVGETATSTHVAREIAKSPHAGFWLIGAVTSNAGHDELLPGLPVVAHYDELLAAIDRLNIDTLIMTTHDSVEPERMRRIGWALEARNVRLVLAAALTDIADSRIHTRPVSGLPLIHVEHPRFSGAKQLAKRCFDLCGALALLVLLSPVFLLVALLIKLDSPGPVIFVQRRVGIAGREFSMYKFRSMVVNAEDQLAQLLGQSDGNGKLFKLREDPRVTRFGAMLRKHSLDELPQLVNVVRGSMSFVGPRPPLPSEVAHYARWESRRLLVRPGITGPWQVGGRSDLSWEDSIRLDLDYVENWSMTGDVLILLRTVKAVAIPHGAY